MTSLALFDSSGRPIQLGPELGSGGEGTVYELRGDPSTVVKIYARQPATAKVQKLAAMCKAGSDSLYSFAAWPKAIVTHGANGQCCGLLMPRISGSKEIHELYSPQHRRKHFPNADYRFLVRAARNTAAAFNTLHSRGIVLGDVNQGNLLIDSKAVVRLIDCDSFQVRSANTIFRCEVGVPHFTPPELQGKNLREVDREPNHDLFGLAVVIFHLLCMGRHPYAGKYVGRGEMPLERAIAEHRFAYGRAASALQMSPPPLCVTLDRFPQAAAELFERAFNRDATARRNRPAAADWIRVTEALEKNLVECDDDPGHFFFASNGDCPWCRIYFAGGPNLFVSVTVQIEGSKSQLDLAALLSDLQRIRGRWPARVEISLSAFRAVGRPIPPRLATADSTSYQFLSATALACALICIVGLILPKVLVVTAPASIILGVWRLHLDFNSEIRQVRRRRHTLFQQVKSQYLGSVAQLSHLYANHERTYCSHEAMLRQKGDEYAQIAKRRAAEVDSLRNGALERQREEFLDDQFLTIQSIDGIGAGRIATLAAYGIESAADISKERVMRVPGFGEQLTSRLLEWRRRCEARFRYDPNRGVPQTHIDAINVKYFQEQRRLTKLLSVGPRQLEELVTRWQEETTKTLANLKLPAQAMAQATADLQVADAAAKKSFYPTPVIALFCILMPATLAIWTLIATMAK